MVQADLISIERLFQSRGAATMKDRSPMVTFVNRIRVLRRIPLLVRRKSKRNGGKTEIESMRYLGAEPWSTLKVIKRILNSIRGRIGNQGRC